MKQTTMHRVAILGALAVACMAGCKKDKSGSKPGVQEKAEKQAAINRQAAANLTPSPLFVHIPADTAFVLASFEPFPRAYWSKMAEVMGPEIQSAMQLYAAVEPSDPGGKFLVGLLQEIANDLTAEGLTKSIGLGPEPQFALYGVGIVPVLRLQLADAAALQATLDRHSRKSGLELPTANSGGKSYFRFDDGETVVVAAIADNQLILSGGPVAMVDGALPFILGNKQPDKSMADGGPLKDVAARHGFAPYGVGYIDGAAVTKLVKVAGFLDSLGGDGDSNQACVAEIEALAKRFPRVAFGYDEVSDTRMAMRMVLEMNAELTERLKNMQVDVPGFTDGSLSDRTLFAMGGGVDLQAARAVGTSFADALAELGAGCDDQDMIADASDMRQAMATPLPPGVDKIHGGLFAVLDAQMSPSGPSGVEGYAIIAAADAAALVDTLQQSAPPGMPVLKKDGSFHDVVPEGMVPGLGAIKAAVMDKAVVVATGAKGLEAAQKAVARTGSSPLFFMSYDYGRLMQLSSQAMGPMAGLMPGVNQKIANMFGMATAGLYVSDSGLTMSMDMEMR